MQKEQRNRRVHTGSYGTRYYSLTCSHCGSGRGVVGHLDGVLQLPLHGATTSGQARAQDAPVPPSLDHTHPSVRLPHRPFATALRGVAMTMCHSHLKAVFFQSAALHHCHHHLLCTTVTTISPAFRLDQLHTAAQRRHLSLSMDPRPWEGHSFFPGTNPRFFLFVVGNTVHFFRRVFTLR